MVIQHNMSALNAQRQFGIVGKMMTKHAEKLSSGYRINRASDDAAGLAISEKMRKQIRGLTQGVANTEDGVSLCQVADGALNEVHDMIQRLEELSVKAANGTNSTSDRETIQDEVDQIISEINRISDTTTFNECKIFKGSYAMTGSYVSQAVGTATTNLLSGTGTVVGDFTVYGGTNGVDYTFSNSNGNGVLTILTDTAIAIKNTNPSVRTLTNKIYVNNSVNANITLAGVNIGLSKGGAAFEIADNSTGNVTVTLVGDNTLISDTYCAVLQKNGGVIPMSLS